VGAFALQLWLSIGFAAMSLVSILATAPTYTAPWPPLFALVSILSALSISRPGSARIAAATGTVLVLVGVARILAVGEFYSPLWESPEAVLRILLWGLHVVVGLRSPAVCYESGLRHVLDDANDRPAAPAPLHNSEE